jgi:osmotically-inducible protein OsmY
MVRNIRTVLAVLLLAFQLSGCTSMTGESLGQNVDDTTITTSVKLAVDKANSLSRIGVETVKGTVYLTGVVENAATKDRAATVAREVGGVKNVVNNLQTLREVMEAEIDISDLIQ